MLGFVLQAILLAVLAMICHTDTPDVEEGDDVENLEGDYPTPLSDNDRKRVETWAVQMVIGVRERLVKLGFDDGRRLALAKLLWMGGDFKQVDHEDPSKNPDRVAEGWERLHAKSYTAAGSRPVRQADGFVFADCLGPELKPKGETRGN